MNIKFFKKITLFANFLEKIFDASMTPSTTIGDNRVNFVPEYKTHMPTPLITITSELKFNSIQNTKKMVIL